MRDVDSRALESVAKALLLSGATSGLTEFDDEHLQQVLDVSRMLPGNGLADGFTSLLERNTHVANGVIHSTFDPYDLVRARRLDVAQYSVWVMNHELLREHTPVDGVITDQGSGLRVRGIQLQVARASSWSGEPLETGGTFTPQSGAAAANSLQGQVNFRNLPMLMHPGGDVLLQWSECAQIADAGPARADFHWLLWIGPRGLNPPGVA
jgi:hypothetical protein